MTAPTRFQIREEPTLNRDLTEIDRASVALLAVQPDLEAWPLSPGELVPQVRPRRIWPVIVVMWIGGIAILSAAIATTISLVVG
ncbi:MAG: hypothetical protein ABI399_02685 [Bauldia sp.]